MGTDFKELNEIERLRDQIEASYAENRRLRIELKALADLSQPSMSTFQRLRVANLQRSREWQVSGDSTLSQRVASVVKQLERQRIDARGPTGTYPSTVQLQDLAQEMGDTIVYMDLWAEKMGIDLWKAVTDSFNNKSTEMGFKTRIE